MEKIGKSQVTFIYIALYTIQIVSKQLHSDDNRKMSNCCSAEASSVLIQFHCKDNQLLN